MVINIEANGKTGPKIEGAEMTPCMLDDGGEPVKSSPEESYRILSRLKSFSKEFGTRVRISRGKGYLNMI